MSRPVVLGIDSGTQSTKVVAIDLADGQIVAEGHAPHSGADTQHPDDWWRALVAAVREAAAGFDVRGLAVAGQQHGCCLLDAAGRPVRSAPLWNNVEAAADAERLDAAADFATEVGSRLVASFTIAKLAHLARTEPEVVARAAMVALPHDVLGLRLTDILATDRGDASGSGWWSPASGRIRHDLIALAVGKRDAARLRFPAVCGPHDPAGKLTLAAADELGLTAGIPVGPGTGDNMAAALGVGAAPGEYVVSLGTSGTAFAVSPTPTADPSGEVCGFADATGRYLPLVCLINCTRVLDAMAAAAGLERDAALDLAAQTTPGAGGLLLEPWFGGERTPNLPDAHGTLHGMTLANTTSANLVRAAIDAVAAGLAYALERLRALGVDADIVTLVGGGSRHPAWQQAIADASGLPVRVRGGREHAARGAAMQAAAIVRGEALSDLVARWQPEIVATVTPREEMRTSFRADERAALVARRRTGAPT